MSRVRALLVFVWDFIVGDDWVTAAGVAAALGITALAATASARVWWIMPTAVIMILTLSLLRAERAARR